MQSIAYADFLTAHKITKGHEGIYSNDNTDKGKETVYGISRPNNPNFAGWAIVDRLKRGGNFLQLLAQNEDLKIAAHTHYMRQYWDANKLGMIRADRQLIANEMYDTGVNMGVGIAAKFMQIALNVSNKKGTLYPNISVDGIIGPVTLKLINEHPRPDVLLKLLNVQQGNQYINLCLHDEDQEKYLNGWYNRVFEVPYV